MERIIPNQLVENKLNNCAAIFHTLYLFEISHKIIISAILINQPLYLI